MENKRYKVAFIIGRFQIPHKGHNQLFLAADFMADKVIVLVGSANAALSTTNPFTAEQRINMLARLPALDNVDVEFLPINDYVGHTHRWINAVLGKLDPYVENLAKSDVVMITHTKEGDENLAQYFSSYHSVQVQSEAVNIHATDLRDEMFSQNKIVSVDKIERSTLKYLNEFVRTPQFANLLEEHAYLDNYNKNLLPTFPRNEQCADAVVVQNGHVLLILRADLPGKGQWALPGGFVNCDETVDAACVRELLEETKIKLPENVLKARMADTNGVRFDNPKRSLRGRIITTAFLINLSSSDPLARVRGSDDAAKARWIPLYKLDDMVLYDDHAYIIETMLRGI
jgi:bifunctional NMN adenylyltransferase/nudix hydrolase